MGLPDIATGSQSGIHSIGARGSASAPPSPAPLRRHFFLPHACAKT
ncbi:hypothetical protein BURPS305_1878 [Burkholderia pseudomallei 305]|nr:hypothetical protein BURPS305_1878 [Burkholderia pseudomallei 305]